MTSIDELCPAEPEDDSHSTSSVFNGGETHLNVRSNHPKPLRSAPARRSARVHEHTTGHRCHCLAWAREPQSRTRDYWDSMLFYDVSSR